MGMLNWLVLFWLLGWALGVRRASSSSSRRPKDAPQEGFAEYVHTQCGFTRYPDTCVKTLLGHQKTDILLTLVEKTRDETKMPSPDHSNPSSYQLIEGLHAQHAAKLSSAEYCAELLNMSRKRLDQSILALSVSPRKKKRDIQSWLSAVLTFQQACKDSVRGLPGPFLGQISGRMDYLSRLASNSLALVNRISGTPANSTGRRLTSEQIFPTWLSSHDRKLLQTPVVNANAVVAKDGTGNYRTVSEAIKAASSGGRRFVIYVKSGVYKEKIRTNKDGITLIGDGKYSTIIVGDDSVAGGSSMPGSATVSITGDGFIARDIGFQNTAGPQGKQALALHIASDRSVFFRCSIAGYQDTLYALALRQFYRECDIYGTIDYIFGNAAAVFQNCAIILRRPRSSGSYNAILAHGRSDPGQNTGFSLQRCKIIPSSDFSPVKHSYESYLGRPWKAYSRSVIMQSTIDDAISPRGWVEWDGSTGLKSLYFAEYLNGGPGAGLSKRVQWTGFHAIGPQEASKFTVGNFIGGASWLPSTGVIFDNGLS